MLFLKLLVRSLVRSRDRTLSKPRDSNVTIADKPSESLRSGSEQTGLDDQTPKFPTKIEELKWKLNEARKKLNLAKQYVNAAAQYAKSHTGDKSEHASVRHLISKTEKVLVHAGDKLGLDYMHFKRSVDENFEKK